MNDLLSIEFLAVNALQSIVTFGVGWHLWRKHRRAAKLEAIDGHRQDPRWAVWIGGRGGACPLCNALRPVSPDFNIQGGLGDHVLLDHPTSALASDIRQIRVGRGSQSLS